MAEPSPTTTPVDAGLVRQLAEEFLSRCRRGEPLSFADYVCRYPDLADAIREALTGIALDGESPASDGAPGGDGDSGIMSFGRRLERLGDFRILREVGRGGMGVVYEAEQESLNRRVALKVLQNQLVLDTEQLARFEREARAAAKLHHTNIVPVYGVGACDGLNFYVMQFIQGQGLDRVLYELRRLGSPRTPDPEAVDLGRRAVLEQATEVPLRSVAQLLLEGKITPDNPYLGRKPRDFERSTEVVFAKEQERRGVSLPVCPPARARRAAPASPPFADQHYWHSAARIGVQAAQALAYAHSQGILHRDIKPSNLLLDVHGTVWITDFGLAKATADRETLSRSGDILGTLRYMAPERFEGRDDVRCDVYSLGLTLYELVTLSSAFDETDRNVLIHRVVHQEPPRPRKLNPAVPRDLETIILKAIARDPAHRYQTAQELADDLQRFLDDQPIRARRLSLTEQAARWCRRHPSDAALMAALALALVLGFGGMYWQWQRAEAKAADEATERVRAEVAEWTARGTIYSEADAVRRAQEAERAAAQNLEQARNSLYYSYIARARVEWLASGPDETERTLARCEPERRGWEWHFLHRLNRAAWLTLHASSTRATGVAYSPDGRWLATVAASGPEAIVLWDADHGEKVRAFAGHDGGVWDVAFSPDGRWLATAGADGTARVWDVATGREVRTFRGAAGAVHAIAFRPDGRHLAGGSQDQAIRIWEITSGRLVRTLRGRPGAVRKLVYGPDGTWLASAGDAGAVLIWDADTGAERLALTTDATGFVGLAVSGDGRYLTACTEQNVKLWDLPGGRLRHTLHGYTQRLRAVAFRPDSRALAAVGSDRSVRFWNAADGRSLGSIRGDTGGATALAFHPDGQWLAAAGRDGTVRVFDLSHRPLTGELLTQPGADLSHAEAIRFSADSRRLTVARRGGELLTLDAASYALLDRRRVGLTDAPLSPAEPAALDGAASRVIGVSAADARTVRVWDVHTGREQSVLHGHRDPVQFAILSRDGRRAATAGSCRRREDGPAVEVKVWDAASGRLLLSLADERWEAVTRLALSPDGQWLALAGLCRGPPGGSSHAEPAAFLAVYAADTGREVDRLTEPGERFAGLSYSPDGRRLAAAGDRQQTVLVWEPGAGAPIISRQGPAHACDVAFCPDGRRLAVAGWAGVKVLDADTAEEVFLLRSRSQFTSAAADFNARVCFSPDGRRLAAVCHDALAPVSVWSADEEPPAERIRAVERRAVVRAFHEAAVCAAQQDKTGLNYYLKYLGGRTLESAWDYLDLGGLYAQAGKPAQAERSFQGAEQLGAPADQVAQARSRLHGRQDEPGRKPVPTTKSETPAFPKDCLLLPRTGRFGRIAVPSDPVLVQIACGTWKAPQAGSEVTLPNGSKQKWETAQAAADGSYPTQSRGGGYGYLTVTADDKQVLVLEAAGHGMVYVNGRPRAGDGYGHGYVKLPVLLRPGTNDFLFHIGRGNLRAKLVQPKAPLQFNLADATLPDLIVGESVDSDAAVVVLNATAETHGPFAILATPAGGEPCRTEFAGLPPLGVRKLGFRLRGAAPAKEGACAVDLSLQRKHGDTWQTLDTGRVTLRVRRPEQTHKRTFRSNIDGSVQYFAIVPAKSDRATAAGLVMTLHGAAVEALGQADSYAAKPALNIVAPTNRRPFGFDWEDWGRLDAMEVLELVRQRLKPDPRRIYLTGHSMGGHGTWHLGVTYPDHFAAIGPSAGWVSFWSYVGARRAEKPTPLEEIMQRCTTPSDTLALSPNLAAVGVYVLHGDKDDNVPVRQARIMKERLSKFHKDFVYHEEPGVGHWWGKAGVSGAACVDWPPLFEFFGRHTLPRNADVSRVAFRTASPGVSARSHWATVEAQIHPLRISFIDINCDLKRSRFAGTTDNVARLALDLGHLPADGPVEVELDGQKLSPVPWPAEGTQLWLQRDQGKWSAVPRPPAALKGPHRYGPFKEAFQNRVLFVYGTSGTAEENAWALAKARFDAETFWYRGNASVEIIPDTAFDAAATHDRNVILYGHADSNAAWPKLLAASPVQVRRGGISIGDRTVNGDDLGCLFIRPRPDSDRALVGVVSGSGVTGLRLSDRLPFFLSGVGYPDCLLLGIDQGRLGVRAAGFFGIDWGVASGEFVWAE